MILKNNVYGTTFLNTISTLCNHLLTLKVRSVTGVQPANISHDFITTGKYHHTDLQCIKCGKLGQ